jgi:integrase
VKWRYLTYNPAAWVELPRVLRKERRVLNPDETKRFIETCRKTKNGLIFEFAVLTGTRPEEFLALQWKDIDFERKKASIERALVRHKGWHFAEPKTSRSRRSIVLPNALVHQLILHKQEQIFHRLRAQNLWHDHDLIFCTEFGTPHSLPNLTYRCFRPLLERAGLPRMRVYDLRHTHATLLLAADVNAKIVSERLGHSTVTITLDRYTHVLPGMQQGATDKLERMIFPA